MPCPECGTATAPGGHFCHNCGRALEIPTEGLRVGDRRIVTALFADLVGYTKLVDELDPEEVRVRVDAALGIMGQAVIHFGGSLEKFIGDAVLAVFGVPAAHDDDPLRACLCALEMQHALPRYSVGDQPLELRIGIATGEVVAATRDLAGIRSVALTGDPMTTAARLQQLAEPNEILVDEATASSGEPRIGVERIGERLLRGQRRPVSVCRLYGERRIVSHASRRSAPLIGRDAEKARLSEIIRRTASTGKGGAALVRGEPGVGKSRLLCEMEEVARAAGLAWMWIDNAPHSMVSPFRGVRNMVDWLADEQGIPAGVVGRHLLFGDDVAPNLDPDVHRLMLGAIAVLARDSEMDLLPEEGWESGMPTLADANEIQIGLRLATHLWVTRMVQDKPRCVILDDFHWSDPSSAQLLDIMIRMAADLPLVVLAGSRPPATPDWADVPHVELIELAGLDEASTKELGAAVAGVSIEAESAHWLYERTAGNALFVGEIVRTLHERGKLEQVGDSLRIDGGAARQSVPLSLRALLGARIDALPPGPRYAVETASVIGMTFDERVLLELCSDGCDSSGLQTLVDAGILAMVEGSATPNVQWRFRHQLFLDAAYGRLLADRRRWLHANLADLLERSEHRADAAELARHRMAAGDGARAIELLDRAAREAAAVGAFAEAEGLARTAAELRNGGKVGEPSVAPMTQSVPAT